MLTVFGKCTTTTHTSSNALLNRLLYRGYYSDAETGFYYLNSRYYDPVTCRFINADTSSTLLASPMSLTDKNLFSYCDNNPIVREDNGGMFWDIVFDFLSLASSVVDVIENPTDPKKSDYNDPLSPYHEVPHFHIDRKSKVTSEKWKKKFTDYLGRMF